MNEQILEQLEQLLKQEVGNLGGDFAEIEQLVMRKMLSSGKGVLQRLVDRGRSARFIGYRGPEALLSKTYFKTKSSSHTHVLRFCI